MGARILVPSGNWRVQLRDLDTGNILFETTKGDVFVNSSKRYFIRFRIEAWKDGESVFTHEYDATDRLSWLLSRNEDQTYALEFRVRRTF